MDDVGLHQEFSHFAALSARFHDVRRHTDALAHWLTDEDQCVQSMPDASPAKWHRAHTTWFFEQFVLVPFVAGYQVFDPAFSFLFNSYYEAVGARHPRPYRGLLTRPSVAEVEGYRSHVDTAMQQALEVLPAQALAIVELGLHHEQQHQELLVTDITHAFAANPLFPAVFPDWREPVGERREMSFIPCSGGIHRIGHSGDGFCFDIETPDHKVLLADYEIGSRLVRNREWQNFIEDNGYQNRLTVDVGGVGYRSVRRMDGTIILADARRRLVTVRPGWSSRSRARSRCSPHKLVRSRCVCPLGRRAAAHRSGVGVRRDNARR